MTLNQNRRNSSKFKISTTKYLEIWNRKRKTWACTPFQEYIKQSHRKDHKVRFSLKRRFSIIQLLILISREPRSWEGLQDTILTQSTLILQCLQYLVIDIDSMWNFPRPKMIAYESSHDGKWFPVNLPTTAGLQLCIIIAIQPISNCLG